MKLADLTPRVRRERIMLAVEGILGQIAEPISTAELVKRVAAFLKTEEPGAYVAKELQKATPTGHPARKPTGETFVKYGKTMNRYEWFPSKAAPKPRKEHPATAARRKQIEELKRSTAVNEAETPAVDEWEWTPPVDGDGYLED